MELIYGSFLIIGNDKTKDEADKMIINKSIEFKGDMELSKNGSQDGKFGQAKVIAKFFNPIGAGTWFITEADKLENDDYLLYDYCHLGDDNNAEFGSVLLSELQNLKLPYGLTIERDMYMSKDKKLVDAIKECSFESLPSLFFTVC